MRLNPNRWPGRGWRHAAIVMGTIAVIALASAMVAAPAEAQPVMELAQAGSEQVRTILTRIRNWIMAVIGAIVLVCFSVGAVRYAAARDDPSEIEKAKTAFKSGGWGFALCVLAPLVVEILEGIVA